MIFLLVINIGLLALYILLVMMQVSYFNYLYKSVVIYTNNKIYKTETQVKFVRQLVEEYKDIKKQDFGELDIYIKQRLQSDYIGNFQFRSVEDNIIRIRNLSGVIVAYNIIWAFSANEHKYTIIVWLNLITFLSIILVSIWASLQKRKHDIIMVLKDYIVNQYPLETLKNSQDEINKQLAWENARLRETVTLNNLTIDKQREKIEQLEDRLALDEEYFSASQSLAKERKWRLLNSLNVEDINTFMEEFGM